MNNWEPFKNPPIQEAIFTLNFSEEIILEQLEKIESVEFINKKFLKNKKKIYKATAKFEEIDGDFQIIKSSKTSNGFRFDSNQATLIIKSNQLSYHILGSYTTWENVINDLEEIVKEIKDTLDFSCESIGVRFINKIDFSSTSVILTDFFRFHLILPSELSQSFDNFFLTVSLSKEEMQATIIQTVDNQGLVGNGFGIILDIDVVKPIHKKINLLDIKDDFQALREYKNEIFFNIITEKTRQLLRNK